MSEMNRPNQLSERGVDALTPALTYGMAFFQARDRPWSTKDPEGNIICSVAENKLSSDILHKRLLEVPPTPGDVMTYPLGFRGTPDSRKAMARMLERSFMKGIQVDPSNIVLLSGAGAILDTLFWCICNPGDAVLLPSPIYPAFLNDLKVRNNTHPALFGLDEAQDIAAQLDAASAAQRAQGKRVSAFLLCNPNNPLGTIYKNESVVEIMKWCLRNKCHFVSDEVYGNSVWGEGAPRFTSAEVLARMELPGLEPSLAEQVPELLHIVFGLSKDWSASGLRVGGLHTRNPSLLRALDNLAYFHGCPNTTHWAITQIFSDDAFVDMYLEENARRMRRSYQMLSGALDGAGFRYLPACAAMFLWLDLRPYLPEASWKGEAELWQAMVSECGVLFTPGEACKADEPGFFRICWAWCPSEALPAAVARLQQLFAKKGWGPQRAPVHSNGN